MGVLVVVGVGSLFNRSIALAVFYFIELMVLSCTDNISVDTVDTG